MDSRKWLGQLGLERYADAFEANDIDESVLPELNESDLVSLGITSLGHRKKLLAAISLLGKSGGSVIAVPVAAASGILETRSLAPAKELVEATGPKGGGAL